MKTFITSDTHFGHANIIKYCNRPFDSLEEMNNELIRRWNERVSPEDTVYFLGDFCFRNSPGGKEGEGSTHKYQYYKDQLNGNIIFIKGNHDKNNSLKTKLISGVIRYNRQNFYLTHNPNHANPKFEVNLVGHVHNSWKIKRINDKSIMYNVGVDVHSFRPVSLEEIVNNITKWEKNEVR